MTITNHTCVHSETYDYACGKCIKKMTAEAHAAGVAEGWAKERAEWLEGNRCQSCGGDNDSPMSDTCIKCLEEG